MKRVLNVLVCAGIAAAFLSSAAFAQASGPDVIVGSLHNLQTHGIVGGTAAYSVGTTSCNIGTTNLLWISNTNQHPVIGQNMYRLKNGRFEQIGMSWLKHGFFALSGTLCGSCPNPTDGSTLGVGCSDPYDAGLNGQQSGLGPRSEVNASTGFYPYPFTNPPGGNNTITKRLQALVADVDPAQNAGALYFVEGHYVTADDAAAGNKNNNASYRRVQFSSAANFPISFVSGNGTQQQQPAIMAWAANDSGVTTTIVDVANDGRFIVAFKSTNNGNGTFHYEFAVQNLNSHRSAGSFSVPLRPGEVLSNVGFRDAHYHTGDGLVVGTNYSNLDWTSNVNASSVTWSTESFAVNQNANALRWSSLYNFRFDSNMAPSDNPLVTTIGLWRPGTPTSVQATLTPPAVLTVVSGNDQWANTLTPFAAPLVVRAQTLGGTPLPGLTVNFTLAGTANAASLGAASAITNAQGEASVNLNALTVPGTVTVTAVQGTNSVIMTAYTHLTRATFTGASGVEVLTVNTPHPNFRMQPLIFCIDTPQPPHTVFGYQICTTVDAPQPGFVAFDGVGIYGAPDNTVRTNTSGAWNRVITGLGALHMSGFTVQMQAIMFPGFVYISPCFQQTF